MTQTPDHEHYEMLLVKAVDGVLSADEQREFEEHLCGCSQCAAELADFHLIKETTDAMTTRILSDAHIEPPRERGAARLVLTTSFVLLLVGALLLIGFVAYSFAVATDVPIIIKIGAAAAAAGSLGLLGYVLRLRKRASGRDPYQEIDL
jgi:anti-sigma factor RsiW